MKKDLSKKYFCSKNDETNASDIGDLRHVTPIYNVKVNLKTETGNINLNKNILDVKEDKDKRMDEIFEELIEMNAMKTTESIDINLKRKVEKEININIDMRLESQSFDNMKNECNLENADKIVEELLQ